MRLLRALDRLLNERTRRLAPGLLTDLLDRRDREGIATHQTRKLS